MKSKLNVMVLAVLWASVLMAPASLSAGANKPDGRVAILHSDYETVRSGQDSFTKKVVTPASKDAAKESFAEVFLDSRNALRIVRETYPNDVGRTVYEFYFKNNRLFFVFVGTATANRPIASISNGDLYFIWNEERYYYVEGTLIHWLRDQREVPSTSKEFKKRASSVRTHAINAFRLAKKFIADKK